MNTQQLRNSILQSLIQPQDGWKEVLLKDIVDEHCSISYGIVQQGEHVENGVPVVRPVDLHRQYVTRTGLKCTTQVISNSYSRTVLRGDEILLCVRGTTGIMSLATDEIKGCNVNRGIVPLYFKKDYDRAFVYYQMQSPVIQEIFSEKTTGSALKQLNIKDLRIVKLFFPPLAEQRRIVAKIEELMPLVERYGKAQQALDQLNESLPARLRQSILQEAIFGNHVGIQLSEIKYVKLKDICEIVMGQSPEGNTYNNSDGIEFHQGKVAFGEMFLKPSGVFTTSPTKYAEPDSIVVSVRAPVGTANITKRKICIGRGLACIKPKQDADLLYIYYLLESPEVREYLEDNSTGTTFKAISGKVLQELEVPLPPLSEQKRIVAKVEELFGILKEVK